jgi:hypothetical protein
MPHYTIELIPLGDDEPLRGGVPDQDTRRFANLGEALQLAREMYRGRNATAKGFRIFNAAGELLHAWVPLSSPDQDLRKQARRAPTSGRAG